MSTRRLVMPLLCSLNHQDSQTQPTDGFWFMGLLPQRVSDVFAERYAPLDFIEEELCKVGMENISGEAVFEPLMGSARDCASHPKLLRACCCVALWHLRRAFAFLVLLNADEQSLYRRRQWPLR